MSFYKTPVGQKALSKMTEMSRGGSQIGQAAAKAHLPALYQMLNDRKAQIDKASAGAAAAGSVAPAADSAPAPTK